MLCCITRKQVFRFDLNFSSLFSEFCTICIVLILSSEFNFAVAPIGLNFSENILHLLSKAVLLSEQFLDPSCLQSLLVFSPWLNLNFHYSNFRSSCVLNQFFNCQIFRYFQLHPQRTHFILLLSSVPIQLFYSCLIFYLMVVIPKNKTRSIINSFIY